jgi:chromosome segregation protein
MYLKKIIAHGFKSFADKITIDLENNITGIVGPNGSGKSNVVDAIRWVLGEQSVKSLRGDGNMTDVIFQGSKSRPASNVASVTLIFDNTDHYINLNFSEISIKRRVYRDGTNEYYLNNEQCRLKDITNILLDSGMAKESFNIISQGQIESIISAKPTDRRTMIEEAASVLKYKHRKEEALRKLEKTNNNITRVNDIIKELERQVEPLKKESERALKYIDKKEELKNIEIALISKDITNLNYKYQDKKSKIEEINKEIISITTTNTTNETKLFQYKVKQNELEESIKENQSKLLELTELSEKLNSRKKIILERQKYEVNNTKLHDNLVELKEKELKIKNEININELELEKYKKNLEEQQEKTNIKENEITTTKLDKSNKQNKLSNLVRETLTLKQKINSLKEQVESNSSIPSSVRNILNNPKLDGIHNTLGNLIEIENNYQKAITTILGSSINNIIVENEQNAKQAINYLKANNLGRATFYPLSIMKEKQINEVDKYILNEPGCIDIASNLVKYNNIYKNIIKNQLGNILVIDNIDNANKISKKLNYRYRLVTLDGDVFNVGGSITGGNQKQTNTISLKNELENKINEQKTLEHEIENIENEINRIDNELKNKEDELYLINKEKINIEETLNNKEKHNIELKNNLEEIENDINGTKNILEGKLSEEEENILKEYYESIKKKDEIANNINTLEDEKHDLLEEKEKFEYQLKKENSIYNSKSKELKELEIEVNRLDVKLDTLLNTLNETYNMTYEHATSLYRLELDEDIARTRVNTLKRELKEIGEVNINAPQEYEQISSRYEFLISQREDLINAENTLLEIIKEMDTVMTREFKKTFEIINKNFEETFKELFKGGNASLKLTDPENILETGIEIEACPPGKKLKNISLLSGGEKTFTAISLLFAILKTRPVPFCVLDEVEAALDEVNVDSFGEYVKRLQKNSQFILITHKKKTMEFANTLYGITMQESGVSKLVSVKLEELKN